MTRRLRSDFLLSAGSVIIQPSTEKVVIIWDDHLKCWFLPKGITISKTFMRQIKHQFAKGRKDKGETLETCALRESHEEVLMLTLLILCGERLSLVWLSREVSSSVDGLPSPFSSSTKAGIRTND